MDRQARELLFDPLCNLMGILHDGPSGGVIKISKIVCSHYTLTMSSVVMDHCSITAAFQIFHKRKITFLMLTHPMADLDHCLRLMLWLIHGDGGCLLQILNIILFSCSHPPICFQPSCYDVLYSFCFTLERKTDIIIL